MASNLARTMTDQTVIKNDSLENAPSSSFAPLSVSVADDVSFFKTCLDRAATPSTQKIGAMIRT